MKTPYVIPSVILAGDSRNIEPVIKKIKHYNIYNVDKGGFILRQQAYRTRSVSRHHAQAKVNPSKRGSQTIVKYITTDSFAIPPFLIFRGSVLLKC